MKKRIFFCEKLIILSLVFSLVAVMSLQFSYANDSYITIVVDGNSSSNVDAIFKSDGIGGRGPWYPGYAASSVLKIENKYNKKIILNQIGMDISLSRNDEKLSFGNEDAQDYMEKMKIRVDYKDKLNNALNKVIYDGSFMNFKEGVDCSIPIPDNNVVDLVYTIKMDESAEINTAGISAKADFTVSVKEDYKSNSNNSKKSKKDNEYWAHNCIIALLDHGIIQGYPNGKMTIEDYRNGKVKSEIYIKEAVRPEENITRAETAELINNALNKLLDNYGYDKGNDLSKFYDDYDQIADWARPHVMKLTEEGIMKGYPGILNNKKYYFKPNKEISREEMTAVLIRGFGKELKKDVKLNFADKDQISKWAEEYIKAAVQNKVIEGYPDNTFKPSDNITRAEVFTIICKLLGYHDTHKK